jgi:hypothetical protein
MRQKKLRLLSKIIKPRARVWVILRQMENKQTILSEMEEIAPVIAAIGNASPYQLPDGYFEKLPAILIDSLAKDGKTAIEKTPVISMHYARKWATYIAAAMLAGILVTGSFIFSDKISNKTNDKYKSEEMALDQVSDAELANYLEENTNSSVEAIFTDHSEAMPSLGAHMEALTNEKLGEYLLENKHLVPLGFEEPLK